MSSRGRLRSGPQAQATEFRYERGRQPLHVRFAHHSLLEGTGFEASVPQSEETRRRRGANSRSPALGPLPCTGEPETLSTRLRSCDWLASAGWFAACALFLTQDTLPIFDQLLDILDDIPGDVRSHVASPFFYAGLAIRYESERLTEDDRDNLPERINRLRPASFDN